MVDSVSRNCPRCGEATHEEWSYCPQCAMGLMGSTEGSATLSNRIRYVQRGTATRRRRNALIQSLANISIGLAILLMLGGGILLFHPGMVPSLFRPEVSFVLEEIPRISEVEQPADPSPYRVENEWIRVPAGEFYFGQGESAELVELPAYEIQKFEVTNAQWSDYLKAERERLEEFEQFEDSVPPIWHWDPETAEIPFPPSELWDMPVVSITWYQARDYCVNYLANLPGNAGARLPTPAEWVKAGRGGVELPGDGGTIANPLPRRRYPWGNEFLEKDREIPQTAPCNVGSGLARQVNWYMTDRSPYGVIGLAGNVSEFVGIWSRGYLAYMGGCYADTNPWDVRIDIGDTDVAPGSTHRWEFVGFRAARSIEPGDAEDGE